MTDLRRLHERFDVVYDTAATMPTPLGLSLLKPDGVLLDLDRQPATFLRVLVSRRHKIVICSATTHKQGRVASTAARSQLRLPIGKAVPSREGIGLNGRIEAGRKIGGRGLLVMA